MAEKQKEPEIDIDTFFELKEVPATGRVTHVEAPAAQHLLAYAETQGFTHFKIEEWINSAIAEGVILEEDTDRYKALKVWGTYIKRKGKDKGTTAFYSGSPIFTALKKLSRVYIALREDSILIIPEEHFATLQKKYKGNKKARKVIKTLQTNFDFMYNKVKPKTG